jgi:hypothetical protein
MIKDIEKRIRNKRMFVAGVVGVLILAAVVITVIVLY